MVYKCPIHGDHSFIMTLEVDDVSVGKPLCIYCYWEFLEEHVTEMELVPDLDGENKKIEVIKTGKRCEEY